MNERFKELAEQAKEFARKQMAHTMNPDLFYAADFQAKFAELVIDKCIKIANNTMDQDRHSEYDLGIYDAVKEIDDYFGLR